MPKYPALPVMAVAACLGASLAAQQIPLDLDLGSKGPMEELTFQVWADNPAYSLTVEDRPGSDAQCAVIRSNGATVSMTYSLDATHLRGKQVRFAASLLVDYPAISRAQLFVRVDRPAGVGFHAYSPSSRDDPQDWALREIIGTVDEDATRIAIGLRFSGRGMASFSEPKLETVP